MPITLLENIIIPLTLQEKQYLFTTTSHFMGKTIPLHHHLFTTTSHFTEKHNTSHFMEKHNTFSPTLPPLHHIPLTLRENRTPLALQESTEYSTLTLWENRMPLTFMGKQYLFAHFTTSSPPTSHFFMGKMQTHHLLFSLHILKDANECSFSQVYYFSSHILKDANECSFSQTHHLLLLYMLQLAHSNECSFSQMHYLLFSLHIQMNIRFHRHIICFSARTF